MNVIVGFGFGLLAVVGALIYGAVVRIAVAVEKQNLHYGIAGSVPDNEKDPIESLETERDGF